MLSTRTLWFAPLLVGLVVAEPARAQQAPPALTSYLKTTIRLGDKDLAAIERGQAVAKVLESKSSHDIIVFGIIPIDAPRGWLVQRQLSFNESLRAPWRAAFGVFSTPAVATDVGDLSLTKDDVNELRICKPRSCNFKLPAESMTFLSTHVDWAAPTAGSEIVQYAREQMAVYVNDYRQRGAAAMVVYDDNASVKSSDALAALVENSSYLFESAPAFMHYLLSYPSDPLTGVTSAVYWSRDEMPRSRPILGIRGISVFSPPEPGDATLIATKQLWADHYLDANFDVLTLLDRTSPGHDGVYAIVVRQLRFDNLPNNRLYSIRNRVADGLRDQTSADLRRLKETSEAAFGPGAVRQR